MFLGGVQSVIPANFNKTESSLQLIWHARVSICRRKMYSKEKKKRKNLLAVNVWKIHSPHGDQQRKSCQPHRVTLVLPCDGPACSLVACEWTTCCPLQPHAVPQLPTHNCPHATASKRGLETRACCCLRGPKTPRLRVSRIDMCQLIQAKKKEKDAPPPPFASLRKPRPFPFPLSKALPSCCHLNIRAPQKGKGIWHTPSKESHFNRSLSGSVLKWDLTL